MVELTQINCRDTDVKVSVFVRDLFITVGSSTMQGLLAPECWGSRENFEPTTKDWVLDQELSQPEQSAIEFDWPDLFSLGFPETGQPSDLFSGSQYGTMSAGAQNIGVDASSPTLSTVQEVLEFGMAPASRSISEYDLVRKPSIEQANENEKSEPQSSVSGLEISQKRGFVDCSPRQAKRPRQMEYSGDRDSPVATNVSSSPADCRTKRRRLSFSLLSGSLLGHLVRIRQGPSDHKSSHLLSQLHQPAKTREVQKSQKIAIKTSSDRTSGNLRGWRSNDWTSPSNNLVGGVAEALGQLSMTV